MTQTKGDNDLGDVTYLSTQAPPEIGVIRRVIRILPVGESGAPHYPAYLQINGALASDLLSGETVMPTGGSFFRVLGTITKQAEPPVASFADMVAHIKIAFSLSISDLAQVLNVERPTIYAWLDERWIPKEENERRVAQVYRHACYWTELNRKALTEKHFETKVAGHCLDEALRAKKISDNRIKALLDYWATRIPVRITDVPQDSIRAAALRHGIDLTKQSEQQDVIDRITGKRISKDR